MFMDWKNQYSENEYPTQSNLQIQCNPCQATSHIFHRTRTNNFKICMEIQKTSNSQSSLEKEEWNWRIDAFELWFWRRLLRVPWTARRSNESIPKEINPGTSLEGMMLKLKLQYYGHLMRRVDSLEKTLMGRVWGQEEKGTTEDEMA